jgi:hypothetical protein
VDIIQPVVGEVLATDDEQTCRSDSGQMCISRTWGRDLGAVHGLLCRGGLNGDGREPREGFEGEDADVGENTEFVGRLLCIPHATENDQMIVPWDIK